MLQSDMLNVFNIKFKFLIAFSYERILNYVSGLLTASAGATVMISGHVKRKDEQNNLNLSLTSKSTPDVKSSRSFFALCLHVSRLNI